MRRGRSRAVGILAAALVGGCATVVLGGCQAIFGPGFGGPGFDGNFPSPSPIATYRSGTASIAIKGGDTIKLDTIAPGSGLDSIFGSNVRWTGPSGWNLRISGAGSAQGLGAAIGAGGAMIAFDQIADGHHWTTFDPTRCIVDIKVADAKGIRGTASCKGVEWIDALDMQFGPLGPKPAPAPKFDAEVTFEAVP